MGYCHRVCCAAQLCVPGVAAGREGHRCLNNAAYLESVPFILFHCGFKDFASRYTVSVKWLNS